MTRALQSILTDESLARTLADRAYERILTHHTPDARARRLVQIYRRILS